MPFQKCYEIFRHREKWNKLYLLSSSTWTPMECTSLSALPSGSESDNVSELSTWKTHRETFNKMLHGRERSVWISHGIVPSYTCTAIEGLHFLPRPSCLNSSPPVRALARDILFWGSEADFPRLPPARSLDPLGPSSRLSAELLCFGFIGPGPPG